ncbi:arginase family protein [Candidatus Poribacteria bacterium]
MTKKNPRPRNFMGVRRAKFDDARIVILPVPYEGTVTYGKGTRNGPQAIIDASRHVELYDDELDSQQKPQPCPVSQSVPGSSGNGEQTGWQWQARGYAGWGTLCDTGHGCGFC